MPPTLDAAQLCGINAIVACATRFSQAPDDGAKKGSRVRLAIQLHCRGPGAANLSMWQPI
ncbi:MAG TPA: hypothetical protein VJX68_10485 [Candidatus Binatus sp.]|uniref:hypothetical protein n=1 Tax=Candidatus Binatus sp. TaxID=2811406 RepID=UPI002B49AF2E|nr:hypothetical protein [Candidatus Binatus sp.]HKN13607.1 hypothetical protein [Candidatus Binatus sp.]